MAPRKIQKMGRKPPPPKVARPTVLIGALAFLDDPKDRDLVEWWQKIPKGEGGKEVRKAIRAHMRGGEGETQKLKRLEGEVARLAGLVEKLLAGGITFTTQAAPAGRGETEAEVQLTPEELKARAEKMKKRGW